MRGNALSRLTQAADSVSGTITRAYDGLDRLTSETTPQGSVSYVYDAANRRTSATVAGQTGVSYSYDNANRLTQIAQASSTVSFSYDNANRRTSLTLPNGVSMSYSYDNASELTGISYALGQNSLGNLSYSYDLAGRRTSVGGSLAAVNLPNAISTTAYDAANELTQWGTATPTYDANGNTLSDGTNTYVWNARNQLASMNLTGETFQYDPFGRRTSKTILGTTTNYVYDGANPVQELSGTTPTANMLTGIGVDEYFTRTDSTGTAHFLTDALGSTISLTNSSGATLSSYTYEPFGNTTGNSSSTNTYEYTGRENDGTGVYYFRARYFSPSLSRFISEDPARSGIDLFSYAGGNPISETDPSGLWDPQTHDNLIWNALKPCGVDNDTIYLIQQLSRDFDSSLTSQMPWNAPWHSMRSPFQGADNAIDDRNEFINDSLISAFAAYDQGGDWQTPFAQGIHDLMDRTSPDHMQNGVPLRWWIGNFYDHGDMWGSGETWNDMTPQNMQANILMIQGAYQGITGRSCPCGH